MKTSLESKLHFEVLTSSSTVSKKAFPPPFTHKNLRRTKG